MSADTPTVPVEVLAPGAEIPAGLPAANPMLARLLAAREGGGLAAAFAEHPDPTVRMVAELLARRQAEEAEASAEEEPSPPVAPGPPVDLALRRRVRALACEVERLTEINDALAAALGACALCWGDDPACRACGGAGEPGEALPDRELFTRLVLPAVRRLKERPSVPSSRPRHPSRRTDPTPGTERREE